MVVKRLPDEYDDKALVGVVYGGGVAVYDAYKVININMEQGMTSEEAIEHFEFNQEVRVKGCQYL